MVLSFVWPFAQGTLNGLRHRKIWHQSSHHLFMELWNVYYCRLDITSYANHSNELHRTRWNVHSFNLNKCRSIVARQELLCLAGVTDLNHLKASGDMITYNELLNSVTPARFKAGQVILSTASLMGAAFAMFRNLEGDKKFAYKSMFVSSALATFLTGISEPLEFMFMFISPVLYLIYAILAGLAFALSDIINLRIHAFGLIEFVSRIPMMANAGLTEDMINFVLAYLAFFGLNLVVFNFAIKKFKIATPGRLGNYNEEDESNIVSKANVASGSLKQMRSSHY